MMKEYNVGEFYDFQVKGLGNHRIYLEDENKDTFSVYAYDFQIEWDWSSPQVPEETLRCYVKEKYENGKLSLEQSKDILLIVLYPEAYRNKKTVCTFIVDSLKSINGNRFYVVIDAYGVRHMYKPSPRFYSLQPGDEVELYVTRIEYKEKNRSYLFFEEMEEQTSTAPVIVATEPCDDDTSVGEFGEETDKVEFKSTIVYPAGATAPDIDTQMFVILRTIAGFMNAKGGVLYIGVNDNGDAIGIEQDFALLNTSLKDKNVYQQNKDGYENKIRSGINRYLSPIAQELVSIKFTEHNNHTVCVIEVKASDDNVIWFNEREAYKRTGNRTTHLRSEAIEKLVLDKMKLTRPYTVEPTVVNTEDEILPAEVIADTEPDTAPAIVKVAHPGFIKPIGETRQGRGSFYMNLFANGDWSWSKEIPRDKDLEYSIPINSPASKNNLIMVYSDGRVSKVTAYRLHLKAEEGIRRPNGRRNDGARLIKVFHAKDNDVLACFCKQNGSEFVKTHMVSHLNLNQQLSSGGCFLVNKGLDGVTDPEICFVAAEHTQRVSVFMKTENQKSNCLGIQMDLQKNAKFIQVRNTLKALCDIPATKE